MALVLEGLDHEAVHTGELGLMRMDDTLLVQRLQAFDVFITMDLHRQDREWFEVNRRIVESGVRILRIRPSKQYAHRAVPVMVATYLLWKIEEWVAAFEQDARLVILGPQLEKVRALSHEAVSRILALRLSKQPERGA